MRRYIHGHFSSMLSHSVFIHDRKTCKQKSKWCVRIALTKTHGTVLCTFFFLSNFRLGFCSWNVFSKWACLEILQTAEKHVEFKWSLGWMKKINAFTQIWISWGTNWKKITFHALGSSLLCLKHLCWALLLVPIHGFASLGEICSSKQNRAIKIGGVKHNPKLTGFRELHRINQDGAK